MRAICLILIALALSAALVIGLASARLAAQSEPEHGIGRPEAPVRVVEFFSFSCAHCARFHRELLPWLTESYIETGRVYFVARDFPLNLAALRAAQAARCGGPERYFELADALWRDWESWIGVEDVQPSLLQLLATNGIARDRAAACLADGNEIERAILESMRSALRRYEVDRTPTLLINDEVFAGLPARETLQGMIEEKLAAAEDAQR
jgi:protein-disulfide isomerase